MINVKDFVREISKKTGYSQKDVNFVLEIAENIMIDAVKNGDGVKIFKSLSIVPTVKQGYVGVNPRTKESVIVPEKIVPKAKFSKAFKDFCKI